MTAVEEPRSRDGRPAPTGPRVVLAMRPDLAGRLFDERARQRVEQGARVDWDLVLDDFAAPPARGALADAEVLLSGWGCPPLTRDVLDLAPRLRAVVHAGGSIKHQATDACWERGVRFSTAAAANALPVAEYTVAMVLLANKGVHEMAGRYARERAAAPWIERFPHVGNYRKRVGIVGASTIGRRVLELLRPFDLDLVVSDPYLTEAGAAALGARLAPLDDLVAGSDVVSLHAPALPETRHLMDARRLALLRDGATLINTARGALVDTAALTATVLARPVHAVLDVTCPEVLPADSALYDAPRVVLTPHVAGSMGTELLRLGELAVEEVLRFSRGEPFAHAVSPADLRRSA